MTIPPRPSLLALALTLVGAVAVGAAVLTTHTARPAPVVVVALASVALWVARSVLARLGLDRAALVCIVLAALAGASVAAATDGLTIVPAAVGVLAVLGDLAVPAAGGFALAGAVMVLTAVGAVPVGTAVPALLAMLGGLTLSVFAGLSRRQFRRAEEQAALLRERELAMKEEASRVGIARDLHDVLAHSLGGLVVQLDAVDALLEAGDDAAARTRVVDARRLAVEGLADARRAVAALRAPASAAGSEPADVSGGEVERTLRDLLDAHRALGGEARLTVSGGSRTVERAPAEALHRAMQEALSNARKHAPGAPVDARLEWQADRVRLVVSTPLSATAHPELAPSGGGHGLDGMRERFRALPRGGSAVAARAGDRFTVTAEAVL
ncbi:sensor histidine kinase [Leifsonia xyli]|uniref:sensor histidine kinase n=1 Tax=Leifsonia xyli TaxID=1575 RepID=UPI003D66923B